ncbi:FtsB family cell division protein [Algivirga pacifica]|uniref:Septum formation initiator family protein n=1 Tax=Algivirga pacifica TaxID=1162670 RepID=A0ABP9DMD6_9BACT
MKTFLKNLYQKVPSSFKNIYVITLLVFSVWMLFFDTHDQLTIHRLKQRKIELNEKKAFYQKEIDQLEKDMESLQTDPIQLEKFAREKHLLRKAGEDVYIIKKK